MKRRQFIRAASAAVFLPAALEPPYVDALATLCPRSDYAFFDERFEKAHRIAASWSAANEAIPVQGDITSVWSDGLDCATRTRTLHMRGVTTESFRFCLGILVTEHAHFDLHVSRLDRNLLLWTMHTTPGPRARRNG